MRISPEKSRRGAALILALSMVTALFFLGIGFLSLVPTELRAGRKNKQDVSGYFAADAGVIHALAWLESELAAGREPGLRLNRYSGKLKLDETWSFKVGITPDRETAPNGNNSIRSYTIESIAFESEKPRRKVSVRVLQQSFSRYAMFMDTWPSNILYRLGTAGVDGPMHTNDILRLYAPYDSYWNEKQDPMFLGRVTASKVYHNRSHGSAQDGVAYYRGNWSGNSASRRPYSSEGPIAQRYQRMVDGGRENLVTGVAREPLPKTSVTMAEAAWGLEAKGTPNRRPRGAAKVVINPQGGIFINGTVDKMTLAVEQGNPTTTISQNKKRLETKVVETTDSPIKIPAGSILNGTRIRRATTIGLNQTVSIEKSKGRWTVTSVKGLPNGTVYSNGDILDISGELKGRKTIAVEIESSKRIKINGNLTLHGTKPGEKPDSSDDLLGLVGYDVEVSKSFPRARATERNPLYIYAQILAGRDGGSGGFGVEDYNRGSARGHMRIFGGIAQSRVKPWSRLNGGGMSGKIIYNHNAGLTPPPYFPSLAKFKVRAYLEEAAR